MNSEAWSQCSELTDRVVRRPTRRINVWEFILEKPRKLKENSWLNVIILCGYPVYLYRNIISSQQYSLSLPVGSLSFKPKRALDKQLEDKKFGSVNDPMFCNTYISRLWSSSFLPKNLKIKIYRTIILPVVLYEYETWSLTLREYRRLRVFENRVLRKIFGPKRDEVTGEWRKLHNKELHDLCS